MSSFSSVKKHSGNTYPVMCHEIKQTELLFDQGGESDTLELKGHQ